MAGELAVLPRNSSGHAMPSSLPNNHMIPRGSRSPQVTTRIRDNEAPQAVAALREEGFARASAREVARQADCNQALIFSLASSSAIRSFARAGSARNSTTSPAAFHTREAAADHQTRSNVTNQTSPNPITSQNPACCTATTHQAIIRTSYSRDCRIPSRASRIVPLGWAWDPASWSWRRPADAART